MTAPIYGTIKVDEAGVIEDWQPTMNLRWLSVEHYGIDNHTARRIKSLQQLWQEIKSGRFEWREIQEIEE